MPHPHKQQPTPALRGLLSHRSHRYGENVHRLCPVVHAAGRIARRRHRQAWAHWDSVIPTMWNRRLHKAGHRQRQAEGDAEEEAEKVRQEDLRKLEEDMDVVERVMLPTLCW